MKIHICAVARMKAGAEKSLFDDYIARFEKTGRNLGLGPVRLTEIEDKRGGGSQAEAALLERAIPGGNELCVLDERGTRHTSPDFANWLGACRDGGCQEISFVIGGADGIDPELRRSARHSISFGAMVWPHLLARVMLAEQLYRAATILAGKPYHRS